MHPAAGATYTGNNRCSFRVWAPEKTAISLSLVSPEQRRIPMIKDTRGYWETTVDGVPPGSRYFYGIDDALFRPDPASRFQPEGVHGPSEVVDPQAFSWTDGHWKGLPLRDLIIYEIHVGAFTAKGTFEAVVPELDYLRELGVTAVELMPVAQFPGGRNWGYDGVYPYAPQNSYGGPAGLKTLVNACHEKGLAVILDVVYNHLGPEGNYLGCYGPYFTDRYRTPWGDAINFDGPYSDEVRDYFIRNALYWITKYHIDGLRIDAIHGIFDFSATHFLKDIAGAVHLAAKDLSRKVHVIAESDLNDSRVIRPPDRGGYGLDSIWNDDFHHALHTVVTGEKAGYYQDFCGLGHLARSYMEGFVYSGQYSVYRKRRHGNMSADLPARKFIVFSQNHDQVGNRLKGDRPCSSQPLEKLKLSAALVILSPYLPLLFMGEEYGETAPFQYFISHTDDMLVEAVRQGRKKEFASFFRDGEMPDPQAETTFLNCKLNRGVRDRGDHQFLFAFYRELIRLRRESPVLFCSERGGLKVEVFEDKEIMLVIDVEKSGGIFCLYNFSSAGQCLSAAVPEGDWLRLLDSSDERWGGKTAGAAQGERILRQGDTLCISPYSVLVYSRVGRPDEERP